MQFNKTLVLETRPVFRWKQNLFGSALAGAFLTPFIGGIISFIIFITITLIAAVTLNEELFGKIDRVMSGEAIDGELLAQLNMLVPILFYVGMFLLITWFLYRNAKRTNEKTVYRLYSDSLEFTEGFLTKHYRSIKIKDIVGVSWNRN